MIKINPGIIEIDCDGGICCNCQYLKKDKKAKDNEVYIYCLIYSTEIYDYRRCEWCKNDEVKGNVKITLR